MSKIKIKSKVVKSTLQNKDVIDMFHGVIGTDGASISITHQKYNLLEKNVKRFLQVLEILHNVKFMDFFAVFKDNLDMYLFALKRQFTDAFSAPKIDEFLSNGDELVAKLNIVALDYSKVPIEVVNNFNSVYGELKKCSLINTIIVTCKNLIPHKKSIEDINELKDRFLLKGGGMNFAPLPFLIFNFKQIYIDDRLSEDNKDFILTILHKLYTISHEVYDTLSSPDIDVNEFVTIIMSSIDDVKKQIPRCEQAFNKIAESVDLLKGNFNGYYKDYISSNNPTIIMENFVLDVSKNTRASPTLTAQFRKIIAHYRKIASQQANNPKLQTLFQQVDKNFQELENQRKKADMENSDDEEEEPEDDTPMTEEEMKSMEEGLNKVMENIKEKNPALSGMFDKLTSDFGTMEAATDADANAGANAGANADTDLKKITKAEQKKLNQKNKLLVAKAERKAKADAAKARRNPIDEEYVIVNAEIVAEAATTETTTTEAETMAEVTTTETTTAEAITTTAITEATITETITAEDTTTEVTTTEGTTTVDTATEAETVTEVISEAATTEVTTTEVITTEATITEVTTTEATITETTTKKTETKPKAAKKTKTATK